MPRCERWLSEDGWMDKEEWRSIGKRWLNRYRDRIEDLEKNQENPMVITASRIAIMLDLKIEQMDYGSKLPEIESSRVLLKYASDPEGFATDILKLEDDRGFLDLYLRAVIPNRPVWRPKLTDLRTMRAVAAYTFWFYKTHMRAQVYAQFPGERFRELRDHFWVELSRMRHSNRGVLREERESPFSIISSRHIQRNPSAFITAALPKPGMSENSLFIFAPGVDWMSERSRKVYLTVE